MAWTEILTDAGSGVAAGVADQLVQNWDEKRVAATPTLSIWKEGGTYLNYVAPGAVVLGVGMGYLRGKWAERAVIIAGQLAGRKVTHRFTKGPNSPFPSPAPYSNFQRAAALEEARARAAAGRTYEPELSKAGIL